MTQQEYVRREADLLILKLARFVWPMHIVTALLMTIVLRESFSVLRLGGWASWMIGFGLAQGVISFRGAEVDASHETLRTYGKCFDITALCLAAAYGWLGYMLVPTDNEALAAFVGFIISGGILTGTGTHNVHYPMLAGTLLLIIPAQAARAYVDNPGEQGYISVFMLGLFLALMLALGWVLRSFTLRGFKLQWEKSQLAAALEVAKADADSANVAKSRFLAQASHDLRQPIHSMGLFLASLARHPLNADAKEITERLQQSVDGLAELFTSLLDVTLLDTGQIKVTPQALHLPTIFEETAHEFELVAKDAGLQLETHSADIVIESDLLILRRILQNLVANAIRHSRGTKIRISTTQQDERVWIDVDDDGQGIPAAHQERLFAEFERGGGITDAAEGLGLGLAIVRRLAFVAGVHINLQSSDGEGTRFTIGPFNAHHATSGTTRLESLQIDLPTESQRALIIDDDQATLEATAAMLAGWGWEIDAINHIPNTEEIEFKQPSVILSDLDLGFGRTGIDVINDIRQRFGKDIPALIITGNSSLETRQEVQDAGLVLLLKPVRPAQLRSALISLAGG